MGYRPGEWEHLQPVELEALWDAWLWRRSRDIEVRAVSAMWILSAWTKVDAKKVLHSYPGYEEDKG